MSGIWIAAIVVLLVVLALLFLRSRARERHSERRFSVLDAIARVADGGGSLEETLEAIGEILLPEYADFCTIDLVDASEVRRVAVRASGPDRAEIEQRLGARRPALQEEMARDFGTAPSAPRFFEYASEADLRAVAEDEEDLELLRALGIRSGVTVELWTRGRVIGMLTMAVAARAGAITRTTPVSPGSSPAAWRWRWTTPASSPSWSAANGSGRGSPKRCSAACCRRRCPTSQVGRSPPCTVRPAPRTRSAAISTTSSGSPAAGWW